MDPNTPKSRWNPWPVSIISFFTLAIIGCGTFIAFCSRHPADLVAADYYEQEVHYQGRLDRIQRAADASESAKIAYDTSTRKITIALPSAPSQTNAVGAVELYRPSEAQLDRRLKLDPDARGMQSIDAASLRPGLWRVRVSWQVGQQEFYTDQKVIVGEKPS